MKHVVTRVLGGPLIALAIAVLVAVLAGLGNTPTPVLAQGGPEDHSSQPCAECHLDYKSLWATGAHAIAYERESFQAEWARNNNDPDCLLCHTTNYQAHDGTYLAENIQCEACHGLNPASHPPAPFIINRAPSACGSCHTATFEEWRRSPHAFTEDMGTVATRPPRTPTST
jgi:hypothetical protein